MPHIPASRRAFSALPASIQTSRSRQEAKVSVSDQSAEFSHRSDQGADVSRRRRASHRQRRPLLSEHRCKVLWAGGAITLLAMATILPTQVSSQAIADNKCERVIKSGAEISRSQLSSLLSIPEGSTKESIRQVIADPYCALPALSSTASPQKENKAETAVATAVENRIEEGLTEYVLEREAYPLAFDPEAWLVVTYHSGEYYGYDFVFKP